MILSSENWTDIWEVVEDELQLSTEKGVAIIHSLHEVETVCAVKMLQLGLKTRDINYSTYPVDNQAELHNKISKLLEGSLEFRTVMLINCGASKFVQAPASAANVRFVVIDSHRPIHPRYNNEDDHDVFFLLDIDDPLDKQRVPAADILDDMTEEEIALVEEEADRDSDDEDGLDSPAKRQRTESILVSRQMYREKQRQLRKRRIELERYLEMGSSYGKPTPLVLLPLAEMLMGKMDNCLLW
eukprot:GHRR01032391.1.p1 GENE.GHRR01032391.1~~GHRR01032391.1.p1  ORF type:complete len:242 (+),score=77.02 GHRR01032391.1:1582-2307(+)